MARNKTRLRSEDSRSLAFGSIGAAYANVGSATSNEAVIIIVKNNTDAALDVSMDGGVTDSFNLPASSQDTIDISSNSTEQNAGLPVGSQFQVKHQGSAPTSGSVIVQIFYMD